MMRVANIRGPLVFRKGAINNEATPAIGIAYLSAYLKAAGHDVVLVDAVAEGLNEVWPHPDFPDFACQGLTYDETLDRIPDDARVLVFSIMFSGEWPVQRELIRAARERFPDALLVAGGEHVSALTEYVLRDCLALDVCVQGEGERTLLALVEAFEQGRSVTDIPGACFLDNEGRFTLAAEQPRIREIDNLPGRIGRTVIWRNSGTPENPSAHRPNATCRF